MKQPVLDLFSPSVTPMVRHEAYQRARKSDPETSHQAAEPDREIDRARALKALRAAPDGLTDFELGERINRQQTSAGKRRGELRDQGLVEDSGLRRAAPSGASAIVWRAKGHQ